MNEIFQALHFHPTTFVLMAINVLVVMGVLYKLFYKPVGRLLEQRNEEINKSLNEAAQANLRAHLSEMRYAERMANARYEAKKIVDRADDIGENMRHKIVDEARLKANTIIAKAQDEIEAERDRARSELREEVSRLAIGAASKVLEKEIDPKEHQDLIRAFLKEAGRL